MRAAVGRYPVVTFVALTFLVSGTAVCLHLLMLRGTLPPTVVFEKLVGASPSIAAVVLTAYLYGFAWVMRLADRMMPWSAGWAWPLVCLPLPLGVLLAMVGILAGLGACSRRCHVPYSRRCHVPYGSRLRMLGQPGNPCDLSSSCLPAAG